MTGTLAGRLAGAAAAPGMKAPEEGRHGQIMILPTSNSSRAA